MRFLLIFVLVIGFANAQDQDFNAEKIAHNILTIKKASQNYLQDIQSWPLSVDDLINTNYLNTNLIQNYLLLNKKGKLSIVIEVSEKHNLLLKKYISKGIFSKSNKTFSLSVNPVKYRSKSSLVKTKKQSVTALCSNLYCYVFE